MAERKNVKDIAAMSFEDALAELQAIVTQLEKGDTRLEEAIAVYERGMELKKHCEGKLNEAKQTVEKITSAAGGQPRAEPADDVSP
ncbi:MAG: exodeoxyribonuclease VII small subunit [Alphaproteobacteria bacterium]|nr:exodeoxyribonuclease VII small subunit [Alphaproteobacteria bacterium]